MSLPEMFMCWVYEYNVYKPANLVSSVVYSRPNNE